MSFQSNPYYIVQFNATWSRFEGDSGRGKQGEFGMVQTLSGSTREELLTVADIAGYLKVDRESVRRWLRSGALSGINLGRAGWRVRPEDLERFLAERTRDSRRH